MGRTRQPIIGYRGLIQTMDLPHCQRSPIRTNDISCWYPFGASEHSYRFTLRNQCLENIRNIRCYVTFFDAINTKIYRDDVIFPGMLPAGAAKLINFDVDASVRRSDRT